MDRDINFTIVNNTGDELKLVGSPSLKHGKWKTNPPGVVMSGQEITFKAGKQTGAAFGVTGSIEYQDVKNSAVYTLTFNNPHSGSTGATLTCIFQGKTFDLTNQFLDFSHDQSPMTITATLDNAKNF